MAKIERAEVIQKLIEDLRLSPTAEDIPSNTAGYVFPVYDLSDKTIEIVRSASNNATGTATLYTTPTDRDFYLCYCSLSFQADATADNTTVYLEVQTGGATANRYVLLIGKLTTTATTQSVTLTLPFPIKVDRNTPIRIGTAFTAGTCRYAGTIGGYLG